MVISLPGGRTSEHRPRSHSLDQIHPSQTLSMFENPVGYRAHPW
jgi:hypothetical protein